jgi:hypothetical protein
MAIRLINHPLRETVQVNFSENQDSENAWPLKQRFIDSPKLPESRL